MIYTGDLFDVLPMLPAQSVHCVVTSPPYWGLRDYGNPPRVFDGDPVCDHEWNYFTRPGQDGGPSAKQSSNAGSRFEQQQCMKCSAWRGCLGLEPTPELFVAHMVQAFREVHRVLRDDGTLFLNMGDCYATGAGAVGDHPGGGAQGEKWKGGYKGGRNGHEGKHGHLHATNTVDGKARRGVGPMTQPNRMPLNGYKPKDLVGVPWMLAFALRADGWYLRAEIIWAKGVSFCDAYAGSVMPESVQDRPTRSHEQVFLLTKSPRYFYDAEAVREQGVFPAGTLAAKGSGTREGNRRGGRKSDAEGINGRNVQMVGSEAERRDINGSSFNNNPNRRGTVSYDANGYAVYDGTRNLRTVWTISPKPFTEAHFATFPPDLVVPCIKAGTSEKGVCAACGAPWRRLVDKEPIPEDVRADFEAARQRSAEDHGREDGFTTRRPNFQRGRGLTTWEPTCDHADTETVPATVLDCFSGAGTVGVVAAGLHRKYVGIELNAEYIQIAERRIAGVAPLFAVEEAG